MYRPDEAQVVTCGSDKKISIWETFDGSAIRDLDGSTATINGLDVSPDGKYFVSGGDDKLIKVGHSPHALHASPQQVWKYNEGEVVYTGSGHSAPVKNLRICPNQKVIVSVGTDGGIYRWSFPK